MTKKERIKQLEKEVEELKQRLQILEMPRVIGIGDNPAPYLPKPYLPDDYKYPWYPNTGDEFPPYLPIITWSDSTNTWQDNMSKTLGVSKGNAHRSA